MLWICWYSSAEKLMETEKTEEKLKTGLKFPFQTEKFPKTRFSFRYGGVFFLKRRKISDLFSIFQYFVPSVRENSFFPHRLVKNRFLTSVRPELRHTD